MSFNKQLNWAVLGTGVIANEMAQALQNMGKKLYSVGNRTHSKAIDFAKKYGIEKVYDDFHDIFTDPDVDIIYLTTPHNTHYPFMKKALENHKHLFVEKSITLNSRELNECVKLAQENNLILAEAMTIWHMPCLLYTSPSPRDRAMTIWHMPIYKQLWEMIHNNEFGKVQMITVNFGSFKDYDMTNRFFNKNLAGGALLDIGVYALSLTRSFMQSKPTKILSQMLPAPTSVDEQATILLMNEDNQMATIALSLHSKQPKRAMISCEKAYIEIMEFPRANKVVITDAVTGEKQEIIVGDTKKALQYEMEDMEKAILEEETALLQFTYTQDVMDIMTKLRREWNLVYPEEM